MYIVPTYVRMEIVAPSQLFYPSKKMFTTTETRQTMGKKAIFEMKKDTSTEGKGLCEGRDLRKGLSFSSLPFMLWTTQREEGKE